MEKSKKGQITLGVIMVAFIAILVGVIFVQSVAQQVGSSVNTIALANDTLVTTVVDNTPQYITEYKAISDVVIYNATGDALIPASNYTVTNNVLQNGALTVNITPLVVEADNQYAWLVSGTAQPTTYISDGGGRAIASLIVIMFALAIVVVALSPTLRGGILEQFGK